MALEDLEVELAVVLGRTRMPLNRFLRLGRGAVIALDAAEEDIVDILANDLPVARGRVTVDRGAIRVEVTELVRRPQVTRERGARISALGAAFVMEPSEAA
ncbi:FliM/FliN family flagellar motor switch protein [Enterovirga rhinocerotis]|uniref:Flagellar motor switch protein FliN/FliY n=1 Tax=Enterovirga rhinocerotis TaxID=1339210 RepID=A0A4R7C552_9HYPH|nr:FliM/FliN family flagellar motor switch protein [Enterovirga rhinocerotis]TDR93173.1 flagellar motor switch protein FliN/FliY [Enterovirga rhinocerotis]